MKYPSIIRVENISDDETILVRDDETGRFKYALARPLGYPSFKHRCKAGWMVLTGRADALVWEKQ